MYIYIYIYTHDMYMYIYIYIYIYIHARAVSRELSRGTVSAEAPLFFAAVPNCLHCSSCACHPCVGAMLMFSAAFQF